MKTLDELTNEFLRWPLPESVCADLCATKQQAGRVGTNLLSFTEAKQMLEAVVMPTISALTQERDELKVNLANAVDQWNRLIGEHHKTGEALSTALARVAELEAVDEKRLEIINRYGAELAALREDKALKVESIPRRRVLLTLKLGADSRERMFDELKDITRRLQGSELWGECAMGGYSAGYVLNATEDESITHESYFAAIDSARNGGVQP